MANTPNMGLAQPVPLSALDLDAANALTGTPSGGGSNNMALLDAHDHTSGKGVKITPLALNINSNISMGGFALTALGFVGFTGQAGAVSTNSAVYFLASDGNFYVKDGAGNAIRITVSGHVDVSAAGAISGLVGPASAAYNAGTFTWQSNTNIPAVMDSGDIALRRAGATSPKRILIQTVNSLAADLQFILPGALPGQNLSAWVMDTSGNITTSTLADGVTLENTGTVVRLATGAVDNVSLQMAGGGGTAISVKAAGITAAMENAPNAGLSTTSTGNFTGASGAFTDVTNAVTPSVTVTANNRPVMIMLVPDGNTSNTARIGAANSAGLTAEADFQIVRDGATAIGLCALVDTWVGSGNGGTNIPPGAICMFDTGATAGSHSWKLQYRLVSGTQAIVAFCKLYAVQL